MPNKTADDEYVIAQMRTFLKARQSQQPR